MTETLTDAPVVDAQVTETPTETVTPEATVTTPTNTRVEPTLETLTGGKIEPEKPKEAELPEDPVERLKALEESSKLYKDDKEKYEKQIKDLRRIISKGKAPDNIEDYSVFKPDSKYEHHFNEDSKNYETVKGMSNAIDKFSIDTGLNVEQNAQLKNMFAEELLDNRTPEQIKLANQEWIAEQEEKLGGSVEAKQTIHACKEFLGNTSIFSPEEKAKLASSMDGGAEWVSIVNKLNRAINPANRSIPVTPSTAGGHDINSLAREYRENGTSTERRIEIVQYMKKHNLGRLPMPK